MPRSKVSNTSKLILLLPPLLAGLRRVGATALVDLCKCLSNKPEPQIIWKSSRINQERKPTTLRRRKPHARRKILPWNSRNLVCRILLRTVSGRDCAADAYAPRLSSRWLFFCGMNANDRFDNKELNSLSSLQVCTFSSVLHILGFWINIYIIWAHFLLGIQLFK